MNRSEKWYSTFNWNAKVFFDGKCDDNPIVYERGKNAAIEAQRSSRRREILILWALPVP